jgi:uncharacterized protein (TIGR03000 family)
VALVVRVPEGATVWVNGSKTTQTGARREFVSAGLTPGRSYTYLVRARWTTANGLIEDHDRAITVQAGERRAIAFGPPPARVSPNPTPLPPSISSMTPAPVTVAPTIPSPVTLAPPPVVPVAPPAPAP